MRIDQYEKMYKIQNTHWWFVGKADIVEDVINRRAGGQADRRTILDIGCGTGLMLGRLSKYGNAYGIDHSAEAVKFSSRVLNGRVKQGALPDRIPFNDGEFDLITALDVLEHIDDDVASVKTLYRLLKPHGLAIVTVPAYMHLWSNHDMVLEHKRRYTKRHLMTLFDNREWQIEKATYFNTLLYPPILLIRTLNKLFHPNRFETDDAPPSRFMNAIFYGVMRFEMKWLRRGNLPLGVSVLISARKKTESVKTFELP